MPRPHEATLDLPQVHKPPMEPGSILFFHSILHGTTAWRSPWERRTVVQFYASAEVELGPPAQGEEARGFWGGTSEVSERSRRGREQRLRQVGRL